jgi:hypothetical protein
MKQANTYAVPYAFATFGFDVASSSTCGTEISRMYTSCVKKVMAEDKRYDLDQRIAENPKGFALNLLNFRNSLDTYHNGAKKQASDVWTTEWPSSYRRKPSGT